MSRKRDGKAYKKMHFRRVKSQESKLETVQKENGIYPQRKVKKKDRPPEKGKERERRWESYEMIETNEETSNVMEMLKRDQTHVRTYLVVPYSMSQGFSSEVALPLKD